MPSEVENLVLYATNTGLLYETHVAMTDADFATWFEHVKRAVIPLYRREIGPITATRPLMADTATALQAYYVEHKADAKP
jgi:hypothetical protein